MATPKEMVAEFYSEYRKIISGYQNRSVEAEVARKQLKELNQKARDKGIPFVVDAGSIDQETGLRVFDEYEDESSSSDEAYDEGSSD